MSDTVDANIKLGGTNFRIPQINSITTNMMKTMTILAALFLTSAGISAYADDYNVDDLPVGPTGNIFDITTMESYKIHPEITLEMLQVLPGEQAITLEFAQAYDELNLIGFGYEDHIRPEYVEFLEGLNITMFGKHGNALEVGIHPSQQDRLEEIRNQLEIMYPNVELVVETAYFEYVDSFSETSAVNTVIPNGVNSITDTISVSNRATINSMIIGITVNHEDHDEMYMTLTPPNGNPITLFARERGHADGVQTFTYSSATNSNLARLAGTDIFGTWTLNVRDAYRGSDTGTLLSWSLNFDATPTSIPTDGADTSPNQNDGENILDLFFNAIFGDTSCDSLRDDCVPKVGGGYISYIKNNGIEGHASIGLGGIVTNDGRQGFLIAGHTVGHGNDGILIAHELTDTNGNVKYTKLLGTVAINNDIRSSGYLLSDTAFVEYPTECTQTEDHLCYNNTKEYKPTVRPLEIYKSRGQTYTVTGTDRPYTNDVVYATGSRTNSIFTATIYDNSHRIQLPDNVGYTYAALMTAIPQNGDSGGPVFTEPNSNDEVELVGTIIGIGHKNDVRYGALTPWYKIQADLGLQSIL